MNHEEQTGGGLPRQEKTGAVALEEKSEARPEDAQKAEEAPAAEGAPEEPAGGPQPEMTKKEQEEEPDVWQEAREPGSESAPEESGGPVAPEEEGEEEPEEEEEGEALSAFERLSLSGKLLAWLGLVALALAILLGSALILLYLTADMEDVPQAQVSFEGQALEPESYRWSVPVAGPIHRVFHRDMSDEPQRLETVESPTPRLEAAEGFELEITVLDEAGETVFEGTGQSFAVFAFEEEGEYAASITAKKTAGPQVTGYIPEGSYHYEIAFQLSAAPRLEASRDSVAQGSVFCLRLTGVLGEELPRISAPFSPDAIFVRQGEDWVACLDVPYDCATGEYVIQVEAGASTLTQTVNVYARQLRELDTSTLDGTALTPYLGALPEVLEPYMDVADPDIYWTDGFIQPVKGTLLRDYYVNEYTDRITDPTLIALVPDIVEQLNAAIQPRLSLNVTFSLPAGSKVSCPADGRVIFAGVAGGAGRTIVVEHGGGLKSIFYLMNQMNVQEGDFVYQGDSLGTTNDHIICEMRLNGSAVNPWDIWRNLGGLA